MRQTLQNLRTLVLTAAVVGLAVAYSYERDMNQQYSSGQIAVMQPDDVVYKQDWVDALTLAQE